MNDSILVVDDEAAVLHLLRDHLQGLGCDVVEASSAEQALRVVAQTPVDLVLTDLKMPGMDGLTLAEQLLAQDADRPVLLMTAYGELNSAREAVKVGIYEYFVKPFDMNDIAAGIRRALAHRKLVLENRAYQKGLERQVAERTRELEGRIKELEARDVLLRHMLSIHESGETLSLAVGLATKLVGCDAGALYVMDAKEKFQLKAAVGYLQPGEPVGQDALSELEWSRDGESAQAFVRAVRDRKTLFVHRPDEARRSLGIHSFAVAPVRKDEGVIALLELDRKRKDVLVGEADVAPLAGFEPYIALAVMDDRLRDELPMWRENIDDVLKTATKWADL